MDCKQLMQADPDVVIPEDRLSDALALLRSRDVGSLPVVDSRETRVPLGMITDRDAALYLAQHDRRPSEVLCREVMSSPVVFVAPTDDIKVAEEKMRHYQLRRMLVVQAGRLIGIIAQADFAREKPKEARKILEDVSQPKVA
ncbi:MAG: CBS domain-containing protein [Terriglobales bacterium]